MEQIRTGQSFLYRKNGYASTIIEVNMKDKVRGDYLQIAYQNTLKRFPYFKKKLVEKEAKYYLCDDVNSMTVNKTNKFRTLGSMQTGYHLIDVTYIDKSIRVAFHHGLCDGRGIKPFAETLMYYYCTLRYKKTFDNTNIHTIQEKIEDKETIEPFGTELFDYDENKVFQIDKNFYSIPENSLDTSTSYKIEIILDQDEFVNCAKKYNATPSIFTAMLFSKGICKANNIDKPIVCNLAVDLRSSIKMEQTHKNCTGTMYLPYSEKEEDKDLTELATHYRELIKKQREDNTIKYNLNKQIMMFNKLDEIKTLKEKREMLSFFNELSNDTYVISYLGKMQFNDFNEYINYTSFYSQKNRGIIINMVASADNISFTIMQNFETQKYVDKFIENLKQFNISYKLKSITPFTTGSDKSYITASHQAERYM